MIWRFYLKNFWMLCLLIRIFFTLQKCKVHIWMYVCMQKAAQLIKLEEIYIVNINHKNLYLSSITKIKISMNFQCWKLPREVFKKLDLWLFKHYLLCCCLTNYRNELHLHFTSMVLPYCWISLSLLQYVRMYCCAQCFWWYA